ncbi:hypothetical protein OGAPHI_003855 [Ogataea philodendri]|uniref:Uncharacterized protein n=1 Tax=Ogataea philodendri TaxID=1378263 RepID=A0A9P8P680_9ASCO|nr:uncharacterized protein OGAPHI_003855 [Ogataea philodendri]KAH3665667.1 hypothetical protein OGAPHI_003855 [Ogataea philodendri]
MVTHTVYHQNINENVRVELVYENFPVIAGTDELSFILRFRYIGPLNSNNSPAKNSKKQEPDPPTQNDGWFGGRLSSQFSNATRQLFLQQLDSMPENEEEEDLFKDISIYLGYVQLFGYYSINDRIIDASIFENLQKSSTFEGKLAGINGLEITFGQHKKGLLNGLTTLFQSDITTDENTHLIPHYSTTQSILFSDLTFKPSQLNNNSTSNKLTRSFYVNMKLPMDLPPSFRSEAVQLNYNVILGYQLVEKDGSFSNKTMFFPLKIQPYIDKFGRQPYFHLERPRLNQRPSALKNVDLNTSGSTEMVTRSVRRYSEPDVKAKLTKKPSVSILPGTLVRKTSALNLEPLRLGLATIDLQGKPGELPTSFDLDKELEVKQFLGLLKDLNDNDVMEIVKIQENFEKKYHNPADLEQSPRQNLVNILADQHSVQKHEFTTDDDVADMEGQVPVQPQTKYIVKQDHLQLANLTLSKDLVKVGDHITVSISFLDRELETKGVEVRLIKKQVLYRDEYLKRYEYNEVYKGLKSDNSMETTVFHKLASTFNTERLDLNLLVPATVEPQFRTNFFQVKYLIQIKFVLLDTFNKIPKPDQHENGVSHDRKNFDLVSIFTDYKGSVLYRGVDSISNGFEFTVRLPIVVLPSYENDIAQ